MRKSLTSSSLGLNKKVSQFCFQKSVVSIISRRKGTYYSYYYYYPTYSCYRATTDTDHATTVHPRARYEDQFRQLCGPFLLHRYCDLPCSNDLIRSSSSSLSSVVTLSSPKYKLEFEIFSSGLWLTRRDIWSKIIGLTSSGLRRSGGTRSVGSEN